MKSFIMLMAMVTTLSLQAQRTVDKIDRGLVVVPGSSSGNFISWRVLGEEYYDVTYNLYCNGSLIKSGLKVSNYSHTGGNTSSKYQVAAVVRGVEQEKCAAVTSWGSNSLRIPVQAITGRDGKDVTSNYSINDISIGDLDGDGVVEFICKRPCGVANDVSQSNCFNVLDAYDRTGRRLWWIDLGPNMISGADEQWDCVCYDWDEDGKAEVLLRIQDNAYIHYPDGTSLLIGQANVDTRWSGMEYTNSGNEYLLYLEGATGKPYQIGPTSHPNYIDFPNPRGADSDWGSGIAGHRSTKHYFAAPYLDGRHASIFLGRGCYTKHMMKAFDVDPLTHKLTQRWAWECSTGGIWFGQGYHNFQVADVDWDGRDEIVFGSMVIDDNGKGLSTCGLGHGDAQHCSDFDPYRHGQEQYCCNESSPNCNYRNATTSQFYYRSVGTSDDGRALMGNFTNDIPGSQGSTVGTGWVASCADKIISGVDYIGWSDLNQRVYWDGDLLDEYFDSPGTEKTGVVYKVGGGRWDLANSQCNNWSKNNPGGIADIFGDWREEVIMREGGNAAILVFTTNIATSYRIPTLWSDHQYRNAMVWQSMGYNQPPHKSYFLGQMEGITQAPPPLTMNGREEVANGGTINTTDSHLIVCETNDTKVSIQNGASPYMVTFNVPSWVQGNAGNNATTNPAITYKYFTCDVTGGALTGSTRLVKQGDGVLNLPKVDMTYTGETNIWAGTLNFDGSLKNSSLWLNRFAELNSDGGVFRSIKADYAAVVRPGGTDKQGAITTDSLCLGFGSCVELDLYSEGLKCDQLNTKYISVETKTGTAWETYGPAYLMPRVKVIPHLEAGQTLLATGDYVLGTADVVKGNLNDIKIEGVTGQKVSLKVDNGKLVLAVEGVREANTIYWTGATNSIWDYANAMNFDNEGTADFFVSGDKVIFDDAAKTFSVSLKGDLDPDSVIVRSSKAYTISGTGAFVGNTSLVKEGKGTLTLDGAHSYKGTTRISGGTVKVSVLSNANQEKGNLGVVSTNTRHIIIENGASLQTTADVTMGTPIRLQTAEGGCIVNGSGFNMNAQFIGTRLNKKGSGTMTLYADNASLDTLAVVTGAVAVSCTTPAKVLELQGGTVNLNSGNSTTVNVPKGKTATLNCYADRADYNNKLLGQGTITISYPTVVGSGWYAERTHFKGNWSSFEGTLKPVAVQSADGRFCLDNAYGLPKATMDIAEGVIVQNTAKAFTIGKVTGKGSLGGICTLGGSVSGSNTWTVGNEEDFTFEGKIIDASNFVKQGAGKMTFKGSGDYSGTTKISAGELCLNNTSSSTMLGTGALTISSGATLCGKGALSNSLTTVSKGAVLRSGITETNAAGNLQFDGKNVTVNGTIQAYVGSKISFSKFTKIGTLRLNSSSTFVLKGKEGMELAEGAEVQIFDASSIIINSSATFDLCAPNASDASLVWDTSRLASEGVLVVTRATAIENITSPTLQQAEIYTLSGQRVFGRPSQKGVYLVNGVKTVIK